ncbi:DMT family transporter [Aureimonas sp. ME7]|uniref:DMT family transporter n=1 Tax=Aureimonas sp. ME7 TaxID=2744252 RepID=UPI0015F517C8|nr:DMT family transporter [Aureimonas sp. ME7]
MNSKPPGAAAFGRSTLWGVGFMVFGCFMFSVNDAMGKWLVGTYAVGQLILLRSVAAMMVLGPFVWSKGGVRTLRSGQPWLHALRASGSAAETGFFYWALVHLPLANVMTFYLAGPIYVTALSALILKEPVGRIRWAAVLVGFSGVLIALGPDLTTAGWPALIAVAGSFAYAVLMILTRHLASAGEVTLIGWQTVAALVLGLILAPMHWVPPAASDLGFMFLLGVVAMAAHACVNRALVIAPASVVVPYQYTLIVWALLFGVMIFDEVPRPSMLVGAAIITASGVFIFLREQRLETQTTVRTAAATVGAPDDVQLPER